MVNNVICLEGIVSSVRLFASSVLVFLVYRNMTLGGVLRILFLVGVLNAMVTAIQSLCALGILGPLPLWCAGDFFCGNHYGDVWRQRGIFVSLQISSLSALYCLLYLYRRKGFFGYLVLAPFFVVLVFFSSRAIVPFVVAFLVFQAFSSRGLALCLLLFIVFILISNAPGFSGFFDVRYAFYKDLMSFSFDPSLDQSLSENMTFFQRDPSTHELLIGNSVGRNAVGGGSDPFYTRWLFQSGLFSLLFVTSSVVVVSVYLSQFGIYPFLYLVAFIIINMKGEVFTSVGSFDVALLLALLYARQIRFGRHSESWGAPNVV